MLVTPVAVVVVMDLLLLGLLCLFTALVDGLDVIVEDGSDDGDHIGLDNAGADVFRSSDADIDDTLEGKVPLPHSHHILTATLLQDADQTLDAAIDSEDIADASRRCGEIGEMVEGVDEGESGRAIQGPSIIKRRGNTNRRLVDVWNAKVDFPHGCC
jgi:hypothetical protein